MTRVIKSLFVLAILGSFVQVAPATAEVPPSVVIIDQPINTSLFKANIATEIIPR
jgi:hypothetical protein